MGSGVGFGVDKSQLNMTVQSGQSGALGAKSLNDTGRMGGTKSYDIPTIKVLNPALYKEMARKGTRIVDPIMNSLKNIKERHTYLENRQQRIDKRNNEIAKELKEREEEAVRQ